MHPASPPDGSPHMKVLLTGGSGLLGTSIRRVAEAQFPHYSILAPGRSELPLSDAKAVSAWLKETGCDAVIHCAAKVGGIQANIAAPVDFLCENLRINDGVIMGALGAGVPRLIFFGSSSMYPRDYPQPLKEDCLLAAPLDPANEGYALAKIMGSKLCEFISRTNECSYKTLVPCNLFGLEDHFDAAVGHLVPAVITKMVGFQRSGATEVEVWGTGKARREFLFCDDLASFALDVLARVETLPPNLNVGYGDDFSVLEYNQMIADILDYDCTFVFNTSKPEGAARKLLDSSLARQFGWSPRLSIKESIELVVRSYIQNQAA